VHQHKSFGIIAGECGGLGIAKECSDATFLGESSFLGAALFLATSLLGETLLLEACGLGSQTLFFETSFFFEPSGLCGEAFLLKTEFFGDAASFLAAFVDLVDRLGGVGILGIDLENAMEAFDLLLLISHDRSTPHPCINAVHIVSKSLLDALVSERMVTLVMSGDRAFNERLRH
jgi:hypothetical protein